MNNRPPFVCPSSRDSGFPVNPTGFLSSEADMRGGEPGLPTNSFSYPSRGSVLESSLLLEKDLAWSQARYIFRIEQ